MVIIEPEVIQQPRWQKIKRSLTKGSRIKAWYIDTENSDNLFLFKESKTSGSKVFYPEFWSEIIAYELSKHIGIITVPEARICYDPKENIYGVLIKSFLNTYNKNNKKVLDILLEGEDMLSGYLSIDESSIDVKDLFYLQFFNNHVLRPEFRKSFNDILIFDAVIGNTDRHWDNWGYIYRLNNQHIEFAPAYDNGTSMGRELNEIQLESILFDPNKFESYINKCKPIIKIKVGDNLRKLNQFETIKYIISNNYSYSKEWKSQLSLLSDSLIDELLESFIYVTINNKNYSFSQKRSHFVAKLIKTRRDKLSEIL